VEKAEAPDLVYLRTLATLCCFSAVFFWSLSRRSSTIAWSRALLWFDNNAEQAVQFYASTFKNSKTTGVTHYPQGGPGPAGTVMTITFQLDGQEFIALNGGPVYQFSPAISLFVNCETQGEIDEFWEKFSEGGEILECG
jgi:predicted 3-demethylubiquinone-9 3-methyltransferase (glyoxalase superfamily)